MSELPILFRWAFRPQCPVRRRKIAVCWARSSLQIFIGSRCACYPPFSFFQSPLNREWRSVLASLWATGFYVWSIARIMSASKKRKRRIDWQFVGVVLPVLQTDEQRGFHYWSTHPGGAEALAGVLIFLGQDVWGKDEWRKEAANVPLPEGRNDLCATSTTLIYFELIIRDS